MEPGGTEGSEAEITERLGNSPDTLDDREGSPDKHEEAVDSVLILSESEACASMNYPKTSVLIVMCR